MLKWIAGLIGAFLAAWFVARVLCVPYLAKKQAGEAEARRRAAMTAEDQAAEDAMLAAAKERRQEIKAIVKAAKKAAKRAKKEGSDG